MRAHRKNGVGEYVPCRAKDAGSCPYGAYQHREFEDNVARVQYNTIEGTGHDWGELQELYPAMFEEPDGHPGPLARMMRGSAISPGTLHDTIERIATDDSVRDQRDVIASMDWSDPDAVFDSIAREAQGHAIRAYAAGVGVNDPDLPVEMVKEDLKDAYESGGVRTDQTGLESLLNGQDEGAYFSIQMVEGSIARDPDLARGVALAIGHAHGDLVPPEDAEPPTASAIRAFDGRVRSEAVNQYPIAANQYADALRGIADGLESAVKRSRGIRGWGASDATRTKPWSEAASEKLIIGLTIQDMRSAADRLQENAGMDMGDARNAEQAASMLQDSVKTARNAGNWRDKIGRGGRRNDEAFNAAASQCESAYIRLGSTIRRTQGLRGYYAQPVPGTDPITTDDEARCLEALSKLPQWWYYDRSGAPAPKGNDASAFLQDYGVTALRPDGDIEKDPIKAIRRSITRRLSTTKYEAMLSRTANTRESEIIRDGVPVYVPSEANTLPDRLSHLPTLPHQLGQESLSVEERDAASDRGYLLAAITSNLH